MHEAQVGRLLLFDFCWQRAEMLNLWLLLVDSKKIIEILNIFILQRFVYFLLVGDLVTHIESIRIRLHTPINNKCFGRSQFLRRRCIFLYGGRHRILIFHLLRSFLFAFNLFENIGWLSWLWFGMILGFSIYDCIWHRKIYFLIVILLVLWSLLHPYFVDECLLGVRCASWMRIHFVSLYYTVILIVIFGLEVGLV